MRDIKLKAFAGSLLTPAGMTNFAAGMTILTMIACAALSFASCKGGKETGAEKKFVEVSNITRGSIEQGVLFTGNITADSAFDIYPRGTGKVSKKILKEGDPVKRSQPILLVERDEVGFKFKEMPVVSLVDGYVGTIGVDVGSNVSPDTPVATVVDPRRMILKLDVPERYLAVMKPGTEVEMSVDTLQNAKFTGTITTVSPFVRRETRTANVEAEFQNDGMKLKHGMFGRANIVVERRDGVLIAPISGISWEGDKRFVYKIADGKIARAEVKTGLRSEADVEITEGVSEGDKIARGNLLSLKDGEEINIKSK